MKRTAMPRPSKRMPRGEPPKRYTPLERRTALGVARPKPAVPAPARTHLRVRSKGLCEMWATLDCRGWAVDPHHRVTRKDGGRHGEAKVISDRLGNVLHGCRPCHVWVHEHPAAAGEMGWLLDEGVVPTQEPVLYRGEVRYLDDLGGVHDFEQVGA